MRTSERRRPHFYFDALSGYGPSASKVDDDGNYREYEQDVNEKRGDMENNKACDPCKQQQQRDCEKHKQRLSSCAFITRLVRSDGK